MAPSQSTLDLACPCGHRETVPASAAGLTLECPKCGRNMMVLLATPQGEALADIAVIERLTGRKFTPVSEGAHALAPLSYLALLSVAPLAALGAIVHWGNWWPAGAAYPLIGVFWFVGIVIARWGVTRNPA